MPGFSPSRRLIEVLRDLMARRRGFAADREAALALRALASRGPEDACLLPRRLMSLDLDPDEVARLEPAVFCELYGRCTGCESRGECALDLAADIAHPAWQNRADSWHDYCPNAATLTALAERRGLASAWQADCYIAARRPDPVEQIGQRLEAFGISMRP
jgi:hypothetical protein